MATTITFTGDICFTHYFRGLECESDVLADEVKRFIAGADYCIGNIEGPLYDANSKNKKEFKHSSNESARDFLFASKINIWNLANNHIFDYQDDGVASTIRLCVESGAKYVGINNKANNTIMLPNENGIGLVSVTYSEPSMKAYQGGYIYTDWEDIEAIKQSISKVKENCKWCIVIVHGGAEFSSLPMPSTRQLYTKYLDLGADYVIGHHPHVVQNYEKIGNKFIFYSLGNFIFDTDYERVHKHTDKGVLLKLSFEDDSIVWEYLAIRINRDSHRVEVCEKPPIFVNMDQKTYNKLYPVAAQALSNAEKETLIYLHPEKYRNASFVTWFIRDLRLFRHKKYRGYILGKYMSMFRKIPNSEMVSYIRE